MNRLDASRRSRNRGGAAWLLTVVSLLLGAGIWEAVGRWVDQSILPPFSQVVMGVYDVLNSGGASVLASSLEQFLFGVVLSIGMAAVTAALLISSRVCERLLLPYINAGLALPAIAFIPLFMLVFGFGTASALAAIVIFVYFIVTIGIYNGAKSVDPELVEMARALGASRHTVLFRIVLPASLPLTMEGLVVGVSRGVVGMVTGEYLIGTSGIGGALLGYSNNYRLKEMYSTLLIILALGVFIYIALHWLQKYLTAWSMGLA